MPRVLAGLLALAVAPTALAEDWPQHLGPNRDGVSAQTGVVAAWKAGAFERLWQRPAGSSYASSAIVDGVAYHQTDDAKGSYVIAWDLASGAEKWKTRVDAPYQDEMRYNGARATPTVVDGTLVAFSAKGTVAALDVTTGAVRWSVDVVDRFGGQAPTWGYSGSPLVHGGRVYLDPGGSKGGVVALDLADGATVWARPDFVAGYSSPIHAELGGTSQVVVFTGEAVAGFSPDTGSVLWQQPWRTNYDVNAATPLLLGGDRVFVASGYGTGGAALQIGQGGPTQLWASKRMKNRMATSLLHEGHLYGFNETEFVCVDADSGEERWTHGGVGRGTGVLVEGHVLLLDEQCALHLVDATPEGWREIGEPIQVFDDGPCWTAPAISDGLMVVRNDTQAAGWRIAAP